MVAQDAGGAIKGPVRGDVFWGTGVGAGKEAGETDALGRYFVLLPRPAVDRGAARGMAP
jgi:membrane-bound lytic murein transglycosylase A